MEQFSDFEALDLRVTPWILLAWNGQGMIRFIHNVLFEDSMAYDITVPCPDQVHIVDVSLHCEPDVMVLISDGKVHVWTPLTAGLDHWPKETGCWRPLSFAHQGYEPFIYSIGGDTLRSRVFLAFGPDPSQKEVSGDH